MSIQNEDAPGAPPLARGRDPKRKAPDTGKGSVGDVAVNDALIAIGISWGILLFLSISLHKHNI